MIYEQIVKIKNRPFSFIKSKFRNINFIIFLIKYQPIKLIKWDGIENGNIAFFKIWFLGWQDFIVRHTLIKDDDYILHFIDQNIKLPFGLKYWRHNHIIIKKKIIYQLLIN
tara:strand:+ start:202 stop:534 length:333 start_codon:yes stop_codon:yes gene_type:complete